MKITKHILTIGLSDKDTKHQIYTTKQATQKVEQILQSYADGWTIYQTNGGYKHMDGVFIKEKSLRVELEFIDKKRVLQIIDKIKSKECLNQESVIYAIQKLNSNLI